MYYIAKVEVEFEADNSKNPKVKKITEQYLVEAESITHAEAVVHKAFGSEKREFVVKSVSESKIVDVLPVKS